MRRPNTTMAMFTRVVERNRTTVATTTAVNANVPGVSVIVPCYNSSKYLARALFSLDAQTYPKIQVIVVDDGSTDEIDATVAPFASRIKFVRQLNSGPAAARNLGLAHAEGDIVAYLDADDMWHPTKIEQQVHHLLTHPADGLVHTRVSFIGTSDEPLEAPVRRDPLSGRCLLQLVRRNHIILSSVAHWRRLVADQAFEPALRAGEDWDLWLRLASVTSFGYLDAPLTLYRWHDDNTSHRLRLMHSGCAAVMDRCMRRHMSPSVRFAAYSTRARYLLSLGQMEYEAGNKRLARRHFRRSLPAIDRVGLVRLLATLVPTPVYRYVRNCWLSSDSSAEGGGVRRTGRYS